MRIALLALLAAGLSGALAQEERPPEPPPVENPEATAPEDAPAAPAEEPGDEPERDPFAASDRMREGAGDRSRFVPTEAPPALPGLALRGYVEDEEGITVALLEVEGKNTYLVRKDDTVSLPRAGQNLVMRVIEVTNLELHVEIGELRRVVVVR
jgi:hypothetical protein